MVGSGLLYYVSDDTLFSDLFWSEIYNLLQATETDGSWNPDSLV